MRETDGKQYHPKSIGEPVYKRSILSGISAYINIHDDLGARIFATDEQERKILRLSGATQTMQVTIFPNGHENPGEETTMYAYEDPFQYLRALSNLQSAGKEGKPRSWLANQSSK